MWLPLAIFLSSVFLFWWLSLCATIWCGFNSLMALWAGHFTRAAIWGCLSCAGLFWLNQDNWIPSPHQFDTWLKGSATIVGIAALSTFARFCYRQRQATQDTPSSLHVNFEFRPSWDIGDCEVHERSGPGRDLMAVDRIGRRRPRRNIGTKQGPRRIAGPTIIDQ